jgi:hypothetical protein
VNCGKKAKWKEISQITRLQKFFWIFGKAEIQTFLRRRKAERKLTENQVRPYQLVSGKRPYIFEKDQLSQG